MKPKAVTTTTLIANDPESAWAAAQHLASKAAHRELGPRDAAFFVETSSIALQAFPARFRVDRIRKGREGIRRKFGHLDAAKIRELVPQLLDGGGNSAPRSSTDLAQSMPTTQARPLVFRNPKLSPERGDWFETAPGRQWLVLSVRGGKLYILGSPKGSDTGEIQFRSKGTFRQWIKNALVKHSGDMAGTSIDLMPDSVTLRSGDTTLGRWSVEVGPELLLADESQFTGAQASQKSRQHYRREAYALRTAARFEAEVHKVSNEEE